jgi:hypothetical protein
MQKEKYSVYDKKTFNIIRNGLTKDAAIKLASKNKNHEYGSAAWVEDQYKEKHIREQLNKIIREELKTLKEGNLNDGYVELIEMDPNFEKGMTLIHKAWSDWVYGPETKHTMITPAKKELANYVSQIILKKW